MTTGPAPCSRVRALRAASAFASGAVFACATPPLDFFPGILFGLFGHALVLEATHAPLPRAAPSDSLEAESTTWMKTKRVDVRALSLHGGLFGLAANLVALRFAPEVITRFTPLKAPAAWLALVLLAGAQALPWAASAAVFGYARRHVATLPSWLAYAISVYVATFVPAIFPWTPAGGLALWPVLLQTADVVGERGVSLLLAAACGLAAHAGLRAWNAHHSASRDPMLARGRPAPPPRALFVLRASIAPFLLAFVVLGAMATWGTWRMRVVDRARDEAPRARVSLVQPGFDATDRWSSDRAAMMLERLTTLTKSAEQRGADLTVWPESAYPFTLPHGTRRSPTGPRAVLQPGVQGPVLTGAYMSGAKGLGYNAAFLATRDGAIGTPYDKRHLLWFGETVPLADWFPWLRDVFSRGTGLAAGHESPTFIVGPIRAAVLNCYEDTLPAAGREAMEHAPNLLVNVTNDAWFEGSAEGELHLRLSVLRAIETRRDLVRAVNKGPTSLVDATGRVRARYEISMPGTLPTKPALLETPPTFYVRFGDFPLGALLAITIAVGLARAQHARSASVRKFGS